MKFLIALATLAFSSSSFAGTLYVSSTTSDRILPECEGTVSTQIKNGDLEIEFLHVKNCTNFDIVDANYQPTQFPTKSLQGASGDQGGTFLIPRSYADSARNQLIILVSGQAGDAIVIHLNGTSTPRPPTPPTQPADPTPAPASRGGGRIW